MFVDRLISDACICADSRNREALLLAAQESIWRTCSYRVPYCVGVDTDTEHCRKGLALLEASDADLTTVHRCLQVLRQLHYRSASYYIQAAIDTKRCWICRELAAQFSRNVRMLCF